MKPKVSIVVLNYNGAHLLPACLDSLVQQNYPDFEILVVDSASIDNSREIVQKYQRVQWVGLLSNGGLGPGYNAGAEKAAGEKIFFVNNDMRFDPDCVARLTDAFGEDTLATDPLQFDWEGKDVVHGAQKFYHRWHLGAYGVPFLVPFQDRECGKSIEVLWGCAGAIMIDREKFKMLGGFDPTFFLDYEDLDFCWRGALRGWKTIFVPEARLFHKIGESEDGKLRMNNSQVCSENPAPINARRQLSQCKNPGRFILKTMPWKTICLCFFVEILRIFLGFISGQFLSAYLRLKALALNISEIPSILQERQHIFQDAKVTSSELLQALDEGKKK